MNKKTAIPASVRPFLLSAAALIFGAIAVGPLGATCYESPYDACPNVLAAEADVLIPATSFPANTVGEPMAFVDPHDDLGHRFVPLHGGTIKVWDGGTTFLGTDFLDLSAKLLCCGERGLLALAFHPHYKDEDNGYFYVMFTGNAPAAPGNDGDVVIQRYKRSAGDVNVADPASAETVLVVSRPEGAVNHNGGWLAFGPDGYLYISTGDGGNGCDETIRDAQNPGSLRGKLLRIDVDGDDFPADTNKNYSIPSGNPFVGGGGAAEVWTFGLRNPFRFSFDRANGDIFIGDVGQDNWEEINQIASSTEPPVNFGWVCREGCDTSEVGASSCNDLVADANCVDYTHTSCEYPSSNGYWDPNLCFRNDDPAPWTQIMGGYRYRGAFLPVDYQNRYFFSDAGNSQIWRTGASDLKSATCWSSATGNPYGFGEDHLGELYFVFGAGKRIECLHGGNADGCYWAGWGGIFQDGFESPSHDTSHWSNTVNSP